MGGGGEVDSERVRNKRRARATCVEPGRGMWVDSESGARAGALPDATARVVRVDRRGSTWAGYQEGYITAEVMHDWDQQASAAGSDLITLAAI